MRILSIAVGLVVFFSTATFAAGDDQVRIYRADGTLQCGMGQERALAEDRKNLEEIGATVVSSEKRVLPVMIIQVCGPHRGRDPIRQYQNNSSVSAMCRITIAAH